MRKQLRKTAKNGNFFEKRKAYVFFFFLRIKFLKAVLYTDEKLYANILKKNNKSRLEANQILEILCRAGVLAAEDFEDMSCASSMNSNVYKKIKRLAQVVAF